LTLSAFPTPPRFPLHAVHASPHRFPSSFHGHSVTATTNKLQRRRLKTHQ